MPEEMSPMEYTIHAIQLQARAELAEEIVTAMARGRGDVELICGKAISEQARLAASGTPQPEPTPPPIQGGPWTTHGHQVIGVTVAGPGRPPIYRCGGPGLCKKCSAEAFTLRKRAGLEK